jgi:hypothetical protein
MRPAPALLAHRSATAGEQRARRNSRIRSAGAFVLFVAIAVLLQIQYDPFSSGVWDFDEAGHYVTGVMFHDYIAAGFPESPIAYAYHFQERYPRVSIGHWPPFFYVMQAAWMLLFGASQTAVFLLLAVISATIAWLVYACTRDLLGDASAVILSASYLFLPAVRQYTGSVMAELPVTLLCFGAALAFERYLSNPGTRQALVFSLLAVAAILTKPNGLALALLPPIALLLTRRFSLVKTRALWVPAAVVLLICAPWYVLTFHDAVRGWPGEILPRKVPRRQLAGNLAAFPYVLGIPLLIASVIGVFVTIVRPLFRRAIEPRPAVMFSLIVAVFVFHTAVAPTAEWRHILVAVPALLWFAAASVRSVAAVAPLGRPEAAARLLLAIALCSAVAVPSLRLPHRPRYGAKQAADVVFARGLADSPLLVASACSGEGAITAEVAARDRGHRARVVRGSKLLAARAGNTLRPRYDNAADAIRALDKAGIHTVIVDATICVKESVLPHYRLLLATLQTYPDRFERLDPFSSGNDAANFRLYRLKASPQPLQ